jgi:spore germination protein YaaH
VSCAGASAALARDPAGSAFWAFTGPWDPASAASAVRHHDQLDVIVSGWIGLDSLTAAPFMRYPDSLPRRGARTRYMALVTSESNERFRPALIRTLAADSARLGAAASWIARTAAAAHYSGLVIDFEGHDAADLPALTAVIRAIGDSARARGVGRITVAIPAADTLAYPARAFTAADAVLVMLYDEHWNRSGPGPIASPGWVQQWLGARVREAGIDHVVAGLPTYGYRWRIGSDSAAATVGYDEARALAALGGTSLSRQPGSASMHARTADGSEIWIPDAASLDTLAGIVRGAGVGTIALWRLGLEDPAIWTTVIPRRK